MIILTNVRLNFVRGAFFLFIVMGAGLDLGCSSATAEDQPSGHSTPTASNETSAPFDSTIEEQSTIEKKTESVTTYSDDDSELVHHQQSYEVQSVERTVYLEVQGELEHYQTIDMAAESGGEVIAIRVDVGSHIHKGMILAQLENTQLNTQLLQLNQQITETQFSLEGDETSQSELQTQLELDRANFELALSNLSRMEKLATRSVSEMEIDKLENQVMAAKSRLISTQTRIQNTRMRLNHMKEQKRDLEQRIEKLTVVSPISGVVLKRFVDVGEYTAPAPQGKLFQIAQTHPMRLAITIPESYIEAITHPNTTLHLQIPQLQDENIEIKRTIPIVDPQSRRVTLEADIPNSGHRFFAGMFIQGQLKIILHGIFVPSAYVHYNDLGEAHVMIKRKDGVDKHLIVTGITDGDMIMVNSGLNERDMIVASNSL
jgi:RND family efflux transporter MFP subunit